jgi:hypothetical protein
MQNYYENGGFSKVLVSTPTLVKHKAMLTIEPPTLVVSPCLVCNGYFHLMNLLLAPCGCMYHVWCIGFQLQLSKKCAGKTCGLLFNLSWCESVGFESYQMKNHWTAQRNSLNQIEGMDSHIFFLQTNFNICTFCIVALLFSCCLLWKIHGVIH